MTPHEEKILRLESEITFLKDMLVQQSVMSFGSNAFGENKDGVKIPVKEFAYPYSFASHLLYQDSPNRLQTRGNSEDPAKILKGFRLSLDRLKFDPKVKEYFFMLGRKPDMNPDGTYPTVPTFKNACFTIMVLGLEENGTLSLGTDNQPLVYEYLTPISMDDTDITLNPLRAKFP